MLLSTRRPLAGLVSLVVFALSVASCDPNEILTADPDIAPLVGDWDATKLLLSNPDGTGTPVDALALGVRFSLNVQPSGLYTVLATAPGFAGVEIGRISVSQGEMTFHVEFPSAGESRATYHVTDDTLLLTGTTIIGFLPDTEAEAGLEMEMARRQSAFE